MAEFKRIAVILGNGFDLDLGLKTSYKDFWESEHCPKDYPAPIIRHLNQRWQSDIEAVKWYDLENELWYYYQKLENPRNPPDVLSEEEKEFLHNKEEWVLSGYLDEGEQAAVSSLIQKGYASAPNQYSGYRIPFWKDMLQSPVWRDREALNRIKKGLCRYLRSAIQVQPKNNTLARGLFLAVNAASRLGSTVDIFTFNYTPLELIFQRMAQVPIHYMHGNCNDERIIIGTRDDTEMFVEYDFLQKAMDDSFNPPDIVSALREADEVIIFGHSLGENDRQYFAPFFKKQSDDANPNKKDIVIFTRDTSSQREVKHAMQKMTAGHLSSLFSINQLTIIKSKMSETDWQQYMSFLMTLGFTQEEAEECIRRLPPKETTSRAS